MLFTEAAITPEFPNPARDSVTISYALPMYSLVKFRVINRYGQKVFTLARYENPGYRSVAWYLQDSNGHRVGSDIYRATWRLIPFTRGSST